MRSGTMGATIVVFALATMVAPAYARAASVAAPPQSARQQSADRGLSQFYFDRERDAKGERAQGDRHLAQTLVGSGCGATEARFVGEIPRGANLYAALCADGSRQWVQTWASPHSFCQLLVEAAQRRGGRFACEPNPPLSQ